MVTNFEVPAWSPITDREDDDFSTGDMSAADAATAFGAVVVCEGGVRWHSAARNEEELVARIAGYVREWAPYHLWPEEAARVMRWLDRADPRKAILHYFSTVGARWGAERLHLVGPEGRSAL